MPYETTVTSVVPSILPGLVEVLISPSPFAKVNRLVGIPSTLLSWSPI